MRPLNVKVKGFTSFRDEQELDFRNLEVFAVTGPTGAGKSSLLDAMTYALYGEVERVGRECSQLVSHGLPRMAVTLDFEVDRHEYRITRTTPARTGPTKVLLERKVDGDWRSFGEGADRVRESNEHIKRLIGLDYTGFTRSVLLPQGKFAEFMAGKPEDRRAIMSDLLGLGLFKRMAQRAGRLGSDAENTGRVKEDVLASQFAKVSQEALADARAAAQEANGRVERLSQVAEAVQVLNETWRVEQLRARELQAYAADLRRWRTRLATAVTTTQSLANEMARHAEALAHARGRVTTTEQAANLAQHERVEAETRWGTALELAPALATARRLPLLRKELTSKQAQLETVRTQQPAAAAALAVARQSRVSAGETLGAAESTLEAARGDERAVEHANMAAALAAGLSVGDPCPVCGDPLERLPEAPAPSELVEATRARKSAEKSLAGAQQAVGAADREVQRLDRDAEEAERALTRLAGELASIQAGAVAAEKEVSGALREPLPADAVAALDERISMLNQLTQREQTAAAEHRDASQTYAKAEHAVELARERMAAQREIVVDPGEALVARATAALESAAGPAWPEGPSPGAEPDVVISFGHAKLAALDAFTGELDRSAASAAEAESGLLVRARVSIGDLIPLAPTLGATVETLNTAATEAVGHRAASVQRVEFLSEALDKRTALEREIAEHKTEATRYQSLATDLRADRLIAFLQDQALKTLAEAGSRYLYDLSSQRYELMVDRDFYVVDKWSADEKRSVRTLSGGETFLASLALALALSEQVRALSVTERARLDSLFLDEGFGTLDPETLRVVVEAIEKLSGGGRLVGVITHVPELAEQFQRVEVVKSPRGSRLQLRS